MLKEGDTAAKRDAMRSFFAKHGYRNGHVTIDNSDWAIDQRLTARLKKDPNADVKPYRDFYLEHMWARSEYYDSLAQRVLGRPVKHTVLVHFNLLNGLFLNDLLDDVQGKGMAADRRRRGIHGSGVCSQAESSFRQARASSGRWRKRKGRSRSRCAIRPKTASMKTRG